MTRVRGPVRIVGVGLLGASIGLNLRQHGVEVHLADVSPSNLRVAVDYGAGIAAPAGQAPELVVVCTPPDVTASVVAAELAAWPKATVTDVASVKASVLAELTELGADVRRFVPGHPLAGRERGGPSAGRADLFAGRPWVIAAHPAIDAAHRQAVEALILDVGASVVEMPAAAHDEAVALVSHTPQLVSSLLARRLVDAPAAELNLAGQGLRDTTRIAGSDPELWVQILEANSAAVLKILSAYRSDLDRVISALADPNAQGARRVLTETIAGGNAGVARIPGKHGQDKRYSSLTVLVDDTPGQLAKLLTEIGEIGVNLEDLRLEHSPAAQVGLAELAVTPEAAAHLASELATRGWTITG